MFRSVDWTHDMIIVKWHLFIWHERKLCALTNAPPVQSTQTGQWLSTLFHANCSAAQVYVLYPAAIHIRSKLQATIILAGITIHWALRKIFWKIFCVSDDDKCYDEKMSWPKNYKNFEFDSRNEEFVVCPKADFFRKRNLSEGIRIFPKAEFVRIFTECSEVWIEHTTW